MSYIAIIVLQIIMIILVFIVLLKNKNTDFNEVIGKIDFLEKTSQRTETIVKEEIKSNREELSSNLNQFQQTFIKSLTEISALQQQNLENMSRKMEEKLSELILKMENNARENRENITLSLKNFQDNFSQNVKEFNELQRQKFGDLALKQDELIKSTELKLEKMRETVDEKLHKTLEERLGQSFEMVSKQLQEVQKGLGEMQTLAIGVGDLKKVLSNVKTRGTLGEVQLGNILEQILSTSQYEANISTKQGSADRVEYAIKLPGKDDISGTVYLPIDAKFPQESYYELQNAYEAGNPEAVAFAIKSLESAIKKSAKDIHDKYIDPPHTTDFGIMFLPVEGLYAEVVRNTNLIEILQRDFKIIVTGPTTLAAILNSLQMGFRTLAIQQRSSEVWKVLGAVKTEFEKFGGILDKARKKIQEADNELESLIRTRTTAIDRKLKQVQQLPTHEASKVLAEGVDNIIDEEENGEMV